MTPAPPAKEWWAARRRELARASAASAVRALEHMRPSKERDAALARAREALARFDRPELFDR